MKRKRIAIILYNDLWIDTRVLNQIKVLKDYFKLFVLCAGKHSDRKDGFEDITVEYVDLSGALEKFRFISSSSNTLFKKHWAKQIGDFVIKHEVSLIHAHDLYLLPPSLEVKKNRDLSVIIDLHENYPEAFKTYSWTKKLPHKLFVDHKFWFEAVDKKLAEADGIIVLSESFRQQLKSTIGTTHTPEFTVYPNVPDLELKKSGLKKKTKADDTFKVFYYGMIGRSRGLHVAAQGINRLNKEDMNIELHIAGRVHKSDRDYFKKEVLKENVVHIPWIELDELGDYVQNMDIGISPIFKNPQHESGVANKVFQYMLFGKPILVSDCISQQDLVEEVECGLAHKDQDSFDFSEKLKWLISNPEKAETMGQNGRRAVLEKFNSPNMAGEIVKMYNRLLA